MEKYIIAIATFETALTRLPRQETPEDKADLAYMIGICYEKEGWEQQSIDSYELAH